MLFGYPVALQQVLILNFMGMGGLFWLWVLRIVSFLLILITLYLWRNILVWLLGRKVANISSIVLLISPLFFVSGFVYPFLCFKLLLFTVCLSISLKNKYFVVGLGLLLILFNWQVLGNKASIFYKLNLKDAQTEVTHRISSEDSLKESIYMPLWWRRVTYNKYFFSYKQILGETLSFFDFESIFFGEINPFSQKLVVIFYWPEIYLFVLGIYYFYNLKNKKLNRFIMILIALSWLDYVFSEGSVDHRLLLVMFPVSIIIAVGLSGLYKVGNWLSRFSFYVVVIFVTFGVINSFVDLNRRNSYWFDNRPIAFEFWFKQLQKENLDKYKYVYVTSIIGDSKKYCYFYLGQRCNETKFVFESFDLRTLNNDKAIYAGFAGEFVGSDFKNNIGSTWYKNDRFVTLARRSLNDNIANKFGNEIGVVVK